ncbi:MAG: MCP four helix bundle domain-containing protein, partial [Candidatus Thiodiazotropha taylori]
MSFLNNLSIKTRLSILVGILLLNTIFIGLLGLRGMQQADHAIDELYNVEMSHMLDLSTVIAKLEDSRAQILLALQHDPSSAFAKMHNHKVDMHTRRIEENIKIVDSRWKAFTNSQLDSEEQRLVDKFTQDLKRLEDEGLFPVDKLLTEGQFYEANQLLLTLINPALQKIQATTAELLKIQENKAAHAFEETHAAYQS